jgi:hypothetical protein
LDEAVNKFLCYAPVDSSEGLHVLQVEEQLSHSLCLVALETLLTSEFGNERFPESYQAGGSTQTLAEWYASVFDEAADPLGEFDYAQWERCASLPPNWKINAFHVFLTCWVLTNPSICVMPWEFITRALRISGRTENDAIHNYRVGAEKALSHCKSEINHILASHPRRELPAVMKERAKILNQVLRRSYRLYYWTPLEADAKAAVGIGIRRLKHTPEDVAAARKSISGICGSV